MRCSTRSHLTSVTVLALIFGYVALSQIRQAPWHAPQSGKGMAVAGVVLGWVGVGVLVIVLLVAALASVGGSA